MTPNFDFERKYWDRGVSCIVGVDEVGRGSFAGPVFAACVGFSSDTRVPANVRVDDSKVLTQNQRESSESWIKRHASHVGVGVVEIAVINKIGIGKASFVAMRRAVKNAEKSSEKSGTIEHLLIDAFHLPMARGFPRKKQTPIVKGDSISISIAAASIIAKVARDKYMQELGQNEDYKKYHWHANKGYGTKAHREAILKHGITKHHRVQFVETFLRNRKKGSIG